MKSKELLRISDSENLNLYESFYYNAPFACQTLDENALIIDVNLKWTEETGYSKNEIIGKPFENLIYEVHKDLFRKKFLHSIKTCDSDPFQIKLIKKDHKLITVSYEACVTYSEKKGFKHINCILRNITEEIKIEENLRRNLELDNLRIEIWKSATIISEEKSLIQALLDKAGPVLGSENISFMPYSDTVDNILVEQVWRLDGTKAGIGEIVPKWIFNQFKKKPYVYLSFDKIPAILKPVLKPFQKKYGTQSTLIIPYGELTNPKGFLSSQTYNYSKQYTNAEINVFIEISNIIYLKSKHLQSQKELEQSQKRYRNLTEQTNEAIVIHKNGDIIDVNPSAEKMFREPKGGLHNKSIFDYIKPKHRDIVRERIKESNTELFEIELFRADGTVFYAETIGKPSFYKDQDVRVISINDITRRKINEKEILKLSAIVEQSPISIVITDLEGNLEYVNPGFLKTTGYTKEEVIGKNPRILSTGYTTKDEYKEMWDQVLSGNVWRGEFFNKRKDGTTYWEYATIAPVVNQSGKIIHLVGLKANISSQKIAEQNLKKSQQELEETLKTRDKLFSIIAHDLRSPFNAILGFSEIMLNKSKEKDFEGFEELSKYVYNSAKNSFELLDNLLHWSRIQTGKLQFSPEKVNLKEVSENILELFKASADDKKISLQSTIKKDIFVFVDRFMIETVIRNLISNAVKFNPVGGKITIDCHKKSKEIVYSVTDTGVGINKDDLQKLFKIDVSLTTTGTTEEKGTGLGLILCKEFIELHKGKISAESEVDKMTTFKFSLPI